MTLAPVNEDGQDPDCTESNATELGEVSGAIVEGLRSSVVLTSRARKNLRRRLPMGIVSKITSVSALFPMGVKGGAA